MINLFLRAKHWQIFIATVGLPIVLYIIFMVNIFSHLLVPNPDPMVVFGYFKYLPVIIILSTGTQFAWQWSVVMGLKKMLPAGVTLKFTQFKIFFFIPLIYFVLIFTVIFMFVGGFINDAVTHNTPPDPAIFFIFPVIFPLHLFAMFCLFYCIYFAAKTLKTVELQRTVVFNDFMAEFFLFWFHFVGVWILQPKINKLIAEYHEGKQNVEEGLKANDF
jgi:hypothetical protein